MATSLNENIPIQREPHDPFQTDYDDTIGGESSLWDVFSATAGHHFTSDTPTASAFGLVAFEGLGDSKDFLHPNKLNQMFPNAPDKFVTPMTVEQASYTISRQKESAHLASIIDAGPTGSSIASFFGVLLGEAVDPINILLTLGTGGLFAAARTAAITTRVGQTLKLGRKLRFLRPRTGMQHFAHNALAGTIGNLAADIPLAMHKEQVQEDFGTSDLLLDAVMGGVIFPALGAAIRHATGRNGNNFVSSKTVEAQLNLGAQQFAAGKRINTGTIIDEIEELIYSRSQHTKGDRVESGDAPHGRLGPDPGVEARNRPGDYFAQSKVRFNKKKAYTGENIYHRVYTPVFRGGVDEADSFYHMGDRQYATGKNYFFDENIAHRISNFESKNNGHSMEADISNLHILDIDAPLSINTANELEPLLRLLLRGAKKDIIEAALSEGHSVRDVFDGLVDDVVRGKRPAADYAEAMRLLEESGFDGIKHNPGRDPGDMLITVFNTDKVKDVRKIYPDRKLLPQPNKQKTQDFIKEQNSYKTDFNFDQDALNRFDKASSEPPLPPRDPERVYAEFNDDMFDFIPDSDLRSELISRNKMIDEKIEEFKKYTDFDADDKAALKQITDEYNKEGLIAKLLKAAGDCINFTGG